ncbi:MAG: hypothetical protein AMS21_02090 [Gemmatimonas sp. SG8_38_2]|nr:MAG: hypothetical protein AMS21_02090 [Gemmatimonas sp. SG8_38_2]
MDVTNIGEVFRTVYNGQMNFMTPSLQKYRKAGNLLVEVSSGVGFCEDTIYGITVLEVAHRAKVDHKDWELHNVHGLGWVAVKKRHDLSCCKGSMPEVNEYIDTHIKGKLNANEQH